LSKGSAIGLAPKRLTLKIESRLNQQPPSLGSTIAKTMIAINGTYFILMQRRQPDSRHAIASGPTRLNRMLFRWRLIRIGYANEFNSQKYVPLG